MSSTYEIWLTDDGGRRIALLSKPAFFSYSRTVAGFGTVMLGFPYDEFVKQVFPVFVPDRRVDIWRSPGFGIPLRRENTYLLRKPHIYTREDSIKMITLYGRDLKDVLRRRYIIQPAGYSQTLKNDYIDDMMKEIVREQMLYGSALDENAAVDNTRAWPVDEFSVQGEMSLGPIIPATFPDRNVLDVLKELHEASLQFHETDPLTYRRIYFDILPYEIQAKNIYILDEDGFPILDESGEPLLDESSPDTSAQQGLEFTTFADLRGVDRTDSALVFSLENGNIESPEYTINHLEEENVIIVKGFGRGDSRQVEVVQDTSRVNVSRWNRCEGMVDASTEPDQTRLADYAYPTLSKKAPEEEINATILNVPGGPNSPRSLYGVDWDLGDLLPVFYADKQFNVEVKIVYVAVDDQGKETITGRNAISGSDQ